MPSVVETLASVGQFCDALQRARAQLYTDTDELAEALGGYVHSLREDGSSCDEVIDEVGARTRFISPMNAAPTAIGWEDVWRRYYALYDTLIQRTIRAYVLDSKEAWTQE